MRLDKLAFAGYRSFAARSPAAPDRPLQELTLAPLTVLLGKNNSGKSTVARLMHHVLLALGSSASDPFPMGDRELSFGSRFRDIQHAGSFFNPLDLKLVLGSEDGSAAELSAQLIQAGELADDSAPLVQTLTFGGRSKESDPEVRIRGLLPDWPEAEPWRQGAQRLLDASCRIGPMRDLVSSSYSVTPNVPRGKPSTQEMAAQMMLADPELRTEVGKWMEQNLEGWRVDVQQNLDRFSLLARRAGRESNMADAGQGIQQVLPVVALCSWRRLGRGAGPFLDVIEQPELHLHDAAQAPLGDLLLSAVSDRRGTLVVETHSEALVLRVRLRIAEGLPPSQVAIYYAEDVGDGSLLRPIPLDEVGEVGWWPEGVFSETFAETKAIRRAQRARGKFDAI